MLDLFKANGLILFKLLGIGREDFAFWHGRREAVKRVHTLGERMRKAFGEIRQGLERGGFLLRERVEKKRWLVLLFECVEGGHEG